MILLLHFPKWKQFSIIYLELKHIKDKTEEKVLIKVQ